MSASQNPCTLTWFFVARSISIKKSWMHCRWSPCNWMTSPCSGWSTTVPLQEKFWKYCKTLTWLIIVENWGYFQHMQHWIPHNKKDGVCYQNALQFGIVNSNSIVCFYACIRKMSTTAQKVRYVLCVFFCFRSSITP